MKAQCVNGHFLNNTVPPFTLTAKEGKFFNGKNDYSNQLLTEMLSLLRRLLEFQKIGKQRALIQGVLRAVDGDTL